MSPPLPQYSLVSHASKQGSWTHDFQGGMLNRTHSHTEWSKRLHPTPNEDLLSLMIVCNIMLMCFFVVVLTIYLLMDKHTAYITAARRLALLTKYDITVKLKSDPTGETGSSEKPHLCAMCHEEDLRDKNHVVGMFRESGVY